MGISTSTLLTKYGVAWYVPCHMGLRGGALPMLRSRGRMFHGACCGLHLMRCVGPLCICGHATVSHVPWVIHGSSSAPPLAGAHPYRGILAQEDRPLEREAQQHRLETQPQPLSFLGPHGAPLGATLSASDARPYDSRHATRTQSRFAAVDAMFRRLRTERTCARPNMPPMAICTMAPKWFWMRVPMTSADGDGSAPNHSHASCGTAHTSQRCR